MQRIFDEAVEERIDDAELDGIYTVLDTMKEHGMNETAKIVERLLVDDGVIDINDEDESDEDNEQEELAKDQFISAVSAMIR